MSQITFIALVLALCLAGACLAIEPNKFNFQPALDYYAAPTPAGLRFSGMPPGENFSVRTGDYGGGHYGYGPGPCSSCGGYGGVCIDWTLLPWYGTWDGQHFHHHHGHCGACARPYNGF